MPIIPVNGHLLIEPIKREGFISSTRDTFEEIGIVLALPERVLIDAVYAIVGGGGGSGSYSAPTLKIGDKVYFDSWLAAKFPKNDEENYWLVKWEDVRAIEKQDA